MTLQVEIGNYMQGLGMDRTVKNKWLWQGMNQLGISVYNVAEDDVAELLGQGIEISNSDYFISANLFSVKTGKLLLKPYVVKSMSLQGTERKFRLGFLGLSGRDSYFTTDAAGYVWEDPLASAKKWLPELRKECDFLTVLACMPAKDAVQLAVDNSNIDLILNGFKQQFSAPAARINQSTLVYAEDEGRILGELRFQIAKGERIDVKPFNHVLTRNVKDDPEMAAFMIKAKAEISSEQRALAGSNGSDISLGQQSASSYITSQNCGACHASAFETWQKSRHAHAIEILKKEKKEFDTSCVVCHVTGAGKAGGFVDLYATSHLANVQCEACHGQGREHSLKPAEVKMTKLFPSICITCHTKSNSPEFEFASYWEKIRH